MAVSVFDLFKIGSAPVSRVTAESYGSLGATGKGHGSDWLAVNIIEC